MTNKMNDSINTLYTMDVILIEGPVSEKFVKRNPSVIRTIEIQGNQTLRDLHNIIFDSFNRTDPHMYEFQVGGKGPNDPNARIYALPEMFHEMEENSKPNGEVSKTTIAALKLSADEAFGYWFDFGDDWWHQVNVTKIEKDKILNRKYPKIINRIGDSPPQYQDFEEK
jgi:hypothetical protein